MHPWIAALIIKEHKESPTVESKCGASLVSVSYKFGIYLRN